jgi:hypothetical protein
MDSATAEHAARVRLGDPVTLVAAMLTQPQLRSWLVRAPVFLAIALPVAGLLVNSLFCGLLFFGIAGLYNEILGVAYPALPGWFPRLIALPHYVGQVLMALSLVVVAERSRRPLPWTVATLAIMALIGAMTLWAVNLPPDGTRHLKILLYIAPGHLLMRGSYTFLAGLSGLMLCRVWRGEVLSLGTVKKQILSS